MALMCSKLNLVMWKFHNKSQFVCFQKRMSDDNEERRRSFEHFSRTSERINERTNKLNRQHFHSSTRFGEPGCAKNILIMFSSIDPHCRQWQADIFFIFSAKLSPLAVYLIWCARKPLCSLQITDARSERKWIFCSSKMCRILCLFDYIAINIILLWSF